MQNFVCAQLLEAIESHANRKFVAHSEDISEAQAGLLVSGVSRAAQCHAKDYSSFGSLHPI